MTRRLEDFDLTDPAARKVAADWLNEQGRDDEADLCRATMVGVRLEGERLAVADRLPAGVKAGHVARPVFRIAPDWPAEGGSQGHLHIRRRRYDGVIQCRGAVPQDPDLFAVMRFSDWAPPAFLARGRTSVIGLRGENGLILAGPWRPDVWEAAGRATGHAALATEPPPPFGESAVPSFRLLARGRDERWAFLIGEDQGNNPGKSTQELLDALPGWEVIYRLRDHLPALAEFA